ncbi:MAG: WYL domain-containing protein [Clostridia bacterium]|nr:WYL domain-containing protein [Clostridia bacterium]
MPHKRLYNADSGDIIIVKKYNYYMLRRILCTAEIFLARPENTLSNKELFYTIDVLDEAISKTKKVEFTYNSYGTDKKLHPNKEGKYIISPYQMVATNGRYYLICNYDKYDNITNYRVDRITDIRIINEPIKPAKKLKGGEIDLPHHMAEHIYMFAGESIRAKFKVKTTLVDQVLDWFGEDVEFSEENNETCVAAVKVNREAFFCWAMQYGMHIEVLEPADMRAKIIDAVKTIGKRYAK